MKEKDMYTLQDLYENLDITMTEFCRRSGLTEGTLANIRKGRSARRSTINKMLKIFSQVYERDFTLENVADLHPLKSVFIDESDVEPSGADATSYGTSQSLLAQKRPSRRKEECKLPENCILARHFAVQHGVKAETFRDHYLIGLGPRAGEKEKANVSNRPKPGREKELEWYLTPEQQIAALDFWTRHGVPYQTSRPGQAKPAQQPVAEERPWFLPDAD